jgi:hypothetical protein
MMKNHAPTKKISKSSINIKSKFKEKQVKVVEKKTEREKFKEERPRTLPALFNKAWVSKVESQKKWKGKNKLLQAFFEQVENIKKIDGSEKVTHLYKLGVLLSKNSVLLLRIHGVRMLGFLFWGLRKNIRKGYKSVLKDLLNMLKDKKATMIKTLIDTLCAGYFIIGPKELYEEISLYNTQRNKDIRINIIQMIERLITFAFEEKHVKEFISNYMGLFISYSEDKDISVKRKLMGLLKKIIVQGRKDLGDKIVTWMENEIQKQVKGSQKMIQSLGEYSPKGMSTTGIGVTSLHQIEIESPQKKVKSRNSSNFKKNVKKSIKRVPDRKQSNSPLPNPELPLNNLIQNLQNGTMNVCNSSIEKLISIFSEVGKKNPLYDLLDKDFEYLIKGLRLLLKNPATSDQLDLMVLHLLTILFDQLNSKWNNITKRNLKKCLEDIWTKSRSNKHNIQEKVFNLVTRIGNNKFYFSELVRTGIKLISQQEIQDFSIKWNFRVITIFSCFDWFSHSNLQGKFLIVR